MQVTKYCNQYSVLMARSICFPTLFISVVLQVAIANRQKELLLFSITRICLNIIYYLIGFLLWNFKTSCFYCSFLSNAGKLIMQNLNHFIQLSCAYVASCNFYLCIFVHTNYSIPWECILLCLFIRKEITFPLIYSFTYSFCIFHFI